MFWDPLEGVCEDYVCFKPYSTGLRSGRVKSVYRGVDGHRHRLVHHRVVVASWQFFDCPESIAIFWSGPGQKRPELVVHIGR